MERPILFSGDMVRAILEGRKTQTRRICKDQTAKSYKWVENCGLYPKSDKTYTDWAKDCGLSFLLPTRCPYGKVGDSLWVRETFRYAIFGLGCGGKAAGVEYKIDGRIKFLAKAQKYARQKNNKDKMRQHARWRSSRFMPKWAARIWLEITGIGVERVQEITDRDACMEGVDRKLLPYDAADPEKAYLYDGTTIKLFRELWDFLNAKRGFGWESNPWVWVIEFKKVNK